MATTEQEREKSIEMVSDDCGMSFLVLPQNPIRDEETAAEI
jgi:hypothetical protein